VSQSSRGRVVGPAKRRAYLWKVEAVGDEEAHLQVDDEVDGDVGGEAGVSGGEAEAGLGDEARVAAAKVAAREQGAAAPVGAGGGQGAQVGLAHGQEVGPQAARPPLRQLGRQHHRELFVYLFFII